VWPTGSGTPRSTPGYRRSHVVGDVDRDSRGAIWSMRDGPATSNVAARVGRRRDEKPGEAEPTTIPRQWIGRSIIAVGTRRPSLSPSSVGATTLHERKSVLQADRFPTPNFLPAPIKCQRSTTIVVLMMENHSFDNILGLMAGATGSPSGPLVNRRQDPDVRAHYIHAFHMQRKFRRRRR